MKNTLHNVNVTPTNRPFIVNGKSDYKIVMPQNPSKKVTAAAAFFRERIHEATGCLLPIENEPSYAFSADTKAIFFGREDVLKQANITMPDVELTASGYFIKTAQNSVFVSVINDYGFHRAAICLLRQLVGYEMYWADSVAYTRAGDTLPDMDIVERPDFTYYHYGIQAPEKGKYGMGFDEYIFMPVDGNSHHNTFKFFPPEQYKETRPEWFSMNDVWGGEKWKDDGSQLCYTARGNQALYREMVETAAAKVLETAEEYSDLNNITITQEDVNTSCGCPACKANYEKYHSYAASIIMFINDVDEIVQARLEQKAKENGTEKRILNIVFFAYQMSETPPAIKNEDGTYRPVDEKVVCRPNVGAYIAPIFGNYQHSFYEKENDAATENIKGWAACTSIIYMWIYDTNYHEYFYPINTWESKIDTFRFLKEMGTIFMHPQSQHNQGNVTHFTRLKDYINAKAMFDVTVEYDAVVDDWFEGYFGVAKAPMRTFFEELKTHLRWCEREHGDIVTGNIYNRMENPIIWEQARLDRYLTLIDEAYQAIAPLKESDPARYAVLQEHILLESMFPRFAKIRMYPESFTAAELLAAKQAYRADCERFNIYRHRETVPTEKLWEEWGI